MNGAVNLTGYHMSFDAEMTSASDMAYFITSFNNGDRTIPTNNELEYYAPYTASGNTYSFQNGALVITATPTASNGLPYTSGLVSTGYSFYQNQGYFEIRAQLASGSGFWPAFWMLAGGPTDFSSEIDILEQPNNNGADRYFTSVKTPTYNQGVFNNAGVDLSAGYHSYGFMWTADSVQFTLDGNYIGSAVATPAALATQKMYLFANLAVGGWAGSPAAGTSAQFKIDYIRAYSNDPNVPSWWGGTGAISSPDGVNTTPNLTGTTPVVTPPVVTPPVATPPVVTPPVVTPPVVTAPIVAPAPFKVNTLTVGVSEDAYLGDAKYRILVDGAYVGDTYTATASHTAGQINQQTVTGTWGSGPHTVGIEFINDTFGPTGDRNLFVSSLNYDGKDVPTGTIAQKSNGIASIKVPAGDTLTLALSEDNYLGDAQFSLAIDGKQVSTNTTVTASHKAGATQSFSFTGLSAGTHDVALSFVNDIYGPTGDRNLYLSGASLNGTALSASTWKAALFSNGTEHFSLVVPPS